MFINMYIGFYKIKEWAVEFNLQNYEKIICKTNI